MGHRRLGELPRTRSWQKVVALLKQTDDARKIADETSRAAYKGLDAAKKNAGVVETIYTLMKVVWAARGDDFKKELSGMGVSLPKDASLMDVVGSVNEALDKKLRSFGHRSDVAEMARLSAIDALTNMCKSETGSLFGVSFQDTQETLKKYATADKFAVVGQNFFGKFTYRFLDYHLSRELPNHIGPDKRFTDIKGCESFKEALALHCNQAAGVVKDFAGCWPSATEWKAGITLENVRKKFVPVAFKKLRSELRKRSDVNA